MDLVVTLYIAFVISSDDHLEHKDLRVRPHHQGFYLKQNSVPSKAKKGVTFSSNKSSILRNLRKIFI